MGVFFLFFTLFCFFSCLVVVDVGVGKVGYGGNGFPLPPPHAKELSSPIEEQMESSGM